jgi:hypothetical protein
MALSARHHYFRVLLLLFQPLHTRERRTNCVSQLFDELGHFAFANTRQPARPPGGGDGISLKIPLCAHGIGKY